MSKNKIGLHFEGFKELAARFDELGGDLKKITEKALKESQQHVTEKIDKAFVRENMPAKGKYWTGATKKSIIRDALVEWTGNVASINVGFDLQESGMKSIYLIYGTPRMSPARGLRAAIYGATTRKEIGAIQQQIFEKAISSISNGN